MYVAREFSLITLFSLQPLHYAVQIPTAESCDIVGSFLEKGANPNISNERNQTPLHLLCHNNKLRELDTYQETLHTLLFHGADPNVQSLTGCTALHLSLYHRDISSAIQLVNRGAQLHVLWKKVSKRLKQNVLGKSDQTDLTDIESVYSQSVGKRSGMTKERQRFLRSIW